MESERPASDAARLHPLLRERRLERKESAPLALKMPSGEDLSDHYAISACLKLEQRRSLRTY